MRRGALGWRLALAFALVAALTTGLAAMLITAMWDRQFEGYVRENVQSRADDAALVFATVYADAGSWDVVRYVDLGHLGMTMRGFRIRLYDDNGDLIGDAVGRGGLPVDDALLTSERGSPVAVTPVVVDGRRVGEVRVTSLYPGGLLTERDLAFRRASLYGLLVAALLAVGAASVAGAMAARGFVRPIERVTAVAERIRAGDMDARTGMTGEGPFERLGGTLDSMAGSIAAEREFERRLTSDVAHELRTPLQAIQATVEAMQDGVLPADPERLGTVREETMRLARLVDQILELSRLESASVPMRREVLDPAEPVRRAAEAHRALMESAGLVFDVATDGGLAVLGDPDRLTQAVGNLLSNAARYTPQGGRVAVSLAAEGGSAVVRVRDTGIGIAPEDLERVFARFWRGDPARRRAKGGVGIGLAVVREIAERHGGAVGVSSGEGGTEFTLTLPLVS